MKSQQSIRAVPSLSEATPLAPRLFSNAHRAETIRQLQQSGYGVDEKKLPKIQEKALGFDPEEVEASMPWVAERGIAIHKAYGEHLVASDPFMMANVSLQTVTTRARNLGHPVVGTPAASLNRPDGVGVYPPQTLVTPLANLVELKPKGTALSGGGPAQVEGYKKSLEECGLATSLMPTTSPLANTILPVPGFGDVQFEGVQDGIVGYTQLRRFPQTVPDLVPVQQEAPEKQPSPPVFSIWNYIQQLADAVVVPLKVAMILLLFLVAIVIMGLMLHLPPPVPV